MSRITADAFVVSARGPDAGWLTGKQRLTLMVRLPSGDVVKSADEPKAEIEQWVVPGMTVGVLVDPQRPWKCEVLMDGIAPLSQRMAEHDWPLCDLEEVAVRVRMAEFDIATDGEAPDGARAQEEQRMRDWQRQRHAHRPQGPVTDADGRLRGTADLISYEVKPGSRNNSSSDRAGWAGRRLYRVWLYGYGPYAVLDKAFFEQDSRKSARALLHGGDVPVTVSPTDRSDVAFQWHEHTRPDTDRGEKITRQALESARAGTLTPRSMKYLYKNTPESMRPAFVQRLQEAGVDVSPIAGKRR